MLKVEASNFKPEGLKLVQAFAVNLFIDRCNLLQSRLGGREPIFLQVMANCNTRRRFNHQVYLKWDNK